jgi:phosphate transport system substrate-binding protein
MSLPRPLLLVFALGWIAAPGSAQDGLVIRFPARDAGRFDGMRDVLAGWHRDLNMTWEASEDDAGFVQLFTGATDVLFTPSAAEEREVRLAGRLGVALLEQLLGLDAVAVIVHPRNPVDFLSLEQLRRVYSGSIVAWHGVVGGYDLPVRPLSPSLDSGLRQVLDRVVLRDDEIAPDAELVEDRAAMVQAVASDPRAIGLVAMTEERSSVKTLAVAVEGREAVAPSPLAVESGDYPLGLTWRIYARGPADEALRRFLASVLLRDGQALVTAAGFVPIPADRPTLRTVVSRERPSGARRESVGFGFRGSRLDAEARSRLEELARAARGSDVEVWVTGHSEPREIGVWDRTLSRDRAASVARFLEERGVSVAEAEGRGCADPVMSNATLDGRRANRRADVWVLLRP